jgi:hypothetical protein
VEKSPPRLFDSFLPAASYSRARARQKLDLSKPDDAMKAQSIEVPLFYKNPLGGEYQEFVGGTCHAMEMFNFLGYEADLLDAAKPGVTDLSVSWHRIADWLPWMEMGDRPGTMIIVSVGKRVANWDAMPESIKAEIKQNYPAYVAPPPLDDKRPNETSWTYFKKVTEKKRAEKKQ